MGGRPSLHAPDAIRARVRRRFFEELELGEQGDDAAGLAKLLGRSSRVRERYVPIEIAGRGGMGQVIRARDGELDRDVAIKVLDISVAHSQATVERMLREARALAQLCHPNVVPVYDVIRDDGRVLIVMEYVPGQTLVEWGRLSRGWQEVVRVVGEAGRGLLAAHGHGLVHRDLKPSNIMVGDDGRVRVLDFGLVEVAGVQPRAPDDASTVPQAPDTTMLSLRTPQGTVVGTPAYMAPEQHEAGPPVGATADQYALAGTTWELLYGVRPFGAATVAGLRRAKLTERPQISRGREVPGWLRRALERGLRPHPQDRHASMAAFLRAIEPRRARRRALRIGGALGVATLLASAAALPSWATRPSTRCPLASRSLARLRSAAAAVRGGRQASDRANPAVLVGRRIDVYVDSLRDQYREVCTASATATDTPSVGALACLDDAVGAFSGAASVLAVPYRDAWRYADALLERLPEPTRCTDPDVLHPRLPVDEAPYTGEVTAIRRELNEVIVDGAAGRTSPAIAHAQRLLTHLKDRALAPRLQAEVALELGRLLQDYGDATRALSTLNAAYALAREHEAEDIAARLAILITYVVGRHIQDVAAGARWRGEAGALVERAKAGASVEAAFLRTAGDLERLAGRQREAIASYEAARAVLQTQPWLGRLPLITVDARIAASYLADDRLPEGLRLLQQVLLRAEALLPSRHPSLGALCSNLALAYSRLPDPEQALNYAARAIKIFDTAYGAGSRDGASARVGAGRALAALGRADEAAALLEQALAVKTATHGEPHLGQLGVLSSLTMVSLASGRNAEAARYARQSLAVVEAVRGEGHRDVAKVLLQLGRAEYRTGDRKRGRSHMRQGIDALLALDGPDSVGAGFGYLIAGSEEFEAGNLTDAEPLLRHAVRILGASPAAAVGHADAQLLLSQTVAAVDPALAQLLARRAYAAHERVGAHDRSESRAWLDALEARGDPR